MTSKNTSTFIKTSSMVTTSRTAVTQKCLLILVNILLTACGVGLLYAGFKLLTDSKRVLLSRLLCASSAGDQLNELPHPFFYYVALVLTGAGAAIVLASLVGWWAVCLNTVCMLTLYFLIVLLLLLIEFSVCLAIVIWPHCLGGHSLDESAMVRALQGGYGMPGLEQLTAAVDLAQTQFECCAITNDLNYDTSLWRLQAHGRTEWTVPLTCCRLDNAGHFGAYLDPMPANETQCQSLERAENAAERHPKGCFDQLNLWYRQQYMLFASITLTVALIEFVVILSIIWNCMRLSTVSAEQHHHDQTKQQQRSSASASSIFKQQKKKLRTERTKSIYSISVQPSTGPTLSDSIGTDNGNNSTDSMRSPTMAPVNTLDVRRSAAASIRQFAPRDRSFDETMSHGDGKRQVFVQPPESYAASATSRYSANMRPNIINRYQYELSRSQMV